MSVEDDKAFDDQIEKMKQKNQHILEKFQASEEDRKQAENHGATIKKDQNISIRLKSDEVPRLRNNRSNEPRPKSFHDKIYQEDKNQISYNQFTNNRKSGKYKNDKLNEIAYQDYMHFQHVYSNKTTNNNFNRPIHRQNSHPNYIEDFNNYKSHQDFNKFNNQSVRNRNQPRFAQNNNFNPNYVKNSKDNEFHGQNYHNSRNFKENNFHNLNQKILKENEFHNYKGNSQYNKESFHKPYNNNNTNQSSKRRPKSKNKFNNNNKPMVDGSGDSNQNVQKKSTLDDEYIDDTLEDLEKYRLKVDMEDFIVIDPESPDPILAMPLKPWTNNEALAEIDANKSDGESKNNEFSANLLNNANERAKDYFNLLDRNTIEHLSCAEFNGQPEFDKIQSTDLTDNSESVESLAHEISTKTDLSYDGNIQISNNNSHDASKEVQGNAKSSTQINGNNVLTSENTENNKTEFIQTENNENSLSNEHPDINKDSTECN